MKRTEVKTNTTLNTGDVIIVGNGPAGLSCATICASHGLKVKIIDKNAPGGKLIYIPTINNYLGISPIPGPALANMFFEKANNAGAEFVYTNVRSVKKDGEIFDLLCEDNLHYYSKFLVICTGNREKRGGFNNEEEFINKGISFCVNCDGGLTRGKNVVVLGNDDECIDSAIKLSSIAKSVIVLFQNKIDPSLLETTKNYNNIKVIDNAIVQNVSGSSFILENVYFYTNDDRTIRKVDANFMFINLGTEPATYFLSNFKEIEQNKNLSVTDGKTVVENMYSAGDVSKPTKFTIPDAVKEGENVGKQIVEKFKKN